MNKQEFTLKFRGVRGGYPMPGPTTNKYGGNTTCFELWVDGHLIIIDAGTGIIGLGREVMAQHYAVNEPIFASLLFTHLHHDHTQGMPFFTPFIDPHSTLYIFGARPNDITTLEEELVRAIQAPLFPLGLEELYSRRQIRHVRSGDMLVFEELHAPPRILTPRDRPAEIPEDVVTVDIHHGYPHPGRVLNFRVNFLGRSLVIATDTEGFVGGDRRLINFSRGADILLHDAEYDEHEYADQKIIHQGWGHSTWRMAVEVAQAAGVKRLGLLHHSPAHTDEYLEAMLLKAQKLFPETFLAQEGLTISLL